MRAAAIAAIRPNCPPPMIPITEPGLRGDGRAVAVAAGWVIGAGPWLTGGEKREADRVPAEKSAGQAGSSTGSIATPSVCSARKASSAAYTA
ncbi:hypothetical protein GCM10011505_08240 [Tistrella bauzanensis]|uniref:Uncharacterized protein n=1 Tax=Tistrella bauzanensis TaxID=657419 RepID=A0ABQ1I968_9PROT|nr:hypothetical protein GCM10011505_08240 [Tistrella bauzanensis]